MPRTYIKKKCKKYTSQDLATAVEKVKSGELTQYRAAQAYNIPLTTIHEHVQNVRRKINAGRPTALLLEDEKKLAETIVVMEKWGFGLSRFEIIELVSEYVRVNNIQTPFKNNTPGPDWFINFRKRHRLSIKKAQPIEFVRKKMTDPFIVAEYYKLLKNTLTDLNLFERPEFIWNLDETSLSLDPTRTKVVGKINKPCARTTQGSGKENITVLAGASASGKKLPPLIVYKGKYVWDTWMTELNNEKYDFELTYAASKKGWMETDIFYNYFEKILIPSLGNERPVLIIYDGHSTHVDVRVVELAISNQITVLKLPPHTSHFLQPLDISVFKSLKMMWDAKLVEWQRRNIGTKMPKKMFAETLADTWQQTSPEIIKSGFKKAGIYPFNDKVIPVDTYDPEAYKRYQKMVKSRGLAELKTPKTLKQICTDTLNKQLPKAGWCEKPITDEVSSLSLISKSDIQNMSFVAKHPAELPICLQNKATQSTTQNSPNVNVLSNIIIKEASVSIQKPVQIQSQRISTFEELMLRKIQQDKKETTSTKKKRITKGAEVITAAVGKKALEMKILCKKTKIERNRKAIKQLQKCKENNIVPDEPPCIVPDEPPCVKSTKGKGRGKKSKGKENKIVSEAGTKDREEKEEVTEEVKKGHKFHDTVLVRYLIRNIWKYFIGFIENIRYSQEETYYTILFLKTTRQQQQLNFILTKKKDIDEVPESLIVKKIDIERRIGNEKLYYLCNEEDAIYF